jgi:hypothetical protein
MSLIGEEDQREPGWPKVCQESWADSFKRWADSGQSHTLTPSLVQAVWHALACNLEYINELEARVAELESRDV